MTAPSKESKKQLSQLQKMVRAQPRTAEEWLVAKSKVPSAFTVNQDGNYVVPSIQQGTKEYIIEVRPEVPATSSYIQSWFQTRRTSLEEPERMVTEAKRNLQAVMTAYKAGSATLADVLGANQMVHDEMCKLSELVKFPRETENLTGVLTERNLTFDRYDTRKVGDTVTRTTYSFFPWKTFWMSPDVADSLALKEVEETAEAEAEAEAAGSVTDGVPTANKRQALTPKQVAIMKARQKAKAAVGRNF